MQHRAGTAIGNYVVEAMIGAGGCGAVYRARHSLTRRVVALKILRPQLDNPDLLARFRREAFIGNEIGHANIIEAFDFGEEDGHAFIAMELLEGMSIFEEVHKHGPMSEERAVPILEQVCNALTAAHELGVVHRDLKPENVFLLQRGGQTDFVKVLDFGIAKMLKGAPDKVKTQSGLVFGTPDTMSPEQCRGETVDPRTDVYSLGVVAFYMLSGRFPFLGNVVEVMTGHMRDAPPRMAALVPSLSAHVALAVDRALAKSRHDRFASIDDFRQALTGGDGLAARSVVTTIPTPPRARKQLHSRRWRTAALAVGALVVSGGALFSYTLSRSASKPPHVAPQPLARPVVVRPMAPSRVLVDLDPQDAIALVNGVRRDERPLSIQGLPGQQLALQLERDGYQPLSQTIAIEGVERSLRVSLTPLARPHTPKPVRSKSAKRQPSEPPPAPLDRDTTGNPFESP